MYQYSTKGLNEEQVQQSREKHGRNTLDYKKENGLWSAMKGLIKEPMVILLLAASLIYFATGNIGDGIFLASAIVIVSAISLYQDSRSRIALEKLKGFSQPGCRVIRDGILQELKIDELVIGDSMLVEEGTSVAADGMIVQSNDFSVNESILTGESLPVYKDATKEDRFVYRGTTVASGLAVVTITAVGHATKLGKIGKSLEAIKGEKTPLELQIGNFIKMMVLLGSFVFGVVWALNFFQSYAFLDSLLKALTLAMSILPEEIPVAFTTFMALGAWRLIKMGVVVKQMKTVETLGSATVICTDKTGTITENTMGLHKLFTLSSAKIIDVQGILSVDEKQLITTAMWASEPIPFDPMEVALHDAYASISQDNERIHYRMIHEYPLAGKPPMMTHVFESVSGVRIIAAKGAPEAIIRVCSLSDTEKQMLAEAITTLAGQGYRVLGVCDADFKGDTFPESQEEFKFSFKGIVAFYDPPKKNIQAVIEGFYGAGIAVKIVTGDNAATTTAIAKEIGLRGYEQTMTGDELIQLSDQELQKRVLEVQIFSRMFPEAKLKIINALKATQQIVAMTGDGVNDGPALKAAHIGVAMGKRGTEIAKQAASLILMEDDLSKMLDAIAMGRKIYTNLKKAIQYIISIHIPIILTVALPLILGWVYPNIFSPVHIIFLELIMGPTCSIIYENEPMEANTLLQKPRAFTNTFFNAKELLTSIVQGLAIALGTLFIYQYAVYHGFVESLTRTMVFTVLITANVILTLVNRSFYYSILATLKYKNNLVAWVIGLTVLTSGLLLYVKPLADFFQFSSPSLMQLGISVAVGVMSVIWYEIVKWAKRLKSK